MYKNRRVKSLAQTIDCSGILYNHCIALHKRYYRMSGKMLNYYVLKKHLTKLRKLEKFSYMKVIPSQSIQNIAERIDKAYKLFFRNLKHNVKTNPPSFKKVKKYKSFTLTQAGYKILEDNKIKIKNRIYKYSKSRDFDTDKIKTITIKRDNLGDFWICITHDVKENVNESNRTMTGKIAGFDFGFHTFLISSDGNDISSPEFFRQNIKKTKRLNRQLSRKVKGSRGFKQSKLALARHHRDMFNKRHDFHFKLANDLAKTYDYMFFEDLDLKGMSKKYGRKVHDLSFAEFIKILENKSIELGSKVHKVSRWFPSSQLCSNCGFQYRDLEEYERSWVCPKCLIKHDRDRNASYNILREGASSCKDDSQVSLLEREVLTDKFLESQAF